MIDDEVGRLREELETANRKLTEAHKMASIGRLSAGIVHEINTPIGSIFSNNEVTVRSLEKARALLSDAKQNASPPPDKALALIESGSCRLVSRNGHVYKSFPCLRASLAQLGHETILDGEIVCLDQGWSAAVRSAFPPSR